MLLGESAGRLLTELKRSPAEGASGLVAATPNPRQPFTAHPFGTLDLELMAQTVWAEARGEPILGRYAVAWVIRNRAERPRWWGRNLREVILKPWQFSCWNEKREHGSQIEAMRRLTASELAPYFELCTRVLAGAVADPSLGADHYCTVAVAGGITWAKDQPPLTRIGDHLFYRLED